MNRMTHADLPTLRNFSQGHFQGKVAAGPQPEARRYQGRVRRPRREWGYWGGATSPSPPARGPGGALETSPAGLGAEPRPANYFSLFWALEKVSPEQKV